MLTVSSISFQPFDRTESPVTTPYQDGCIGDKYKAIINLNWQKGTFTAQSQNISLALAFNGHTITDQTIYGSNTPENFMTDFSIGEVIAIPGSTLNTGNYTITGLTSSTITVSASLTSENCTSLIWVSGLITSLDFYYNLLQQGANPSFASLTDPNSQQKYTVPGLNAGSSTPIYFNIGTSSFGWVTDTISGSASTVTKIVGTGIESGTYIQSFTITHVYFITPLYLTNQLQAFSKANNSQVSPIPPPIYPLSYFYQFDAYYALPTIVDTLQGSVQGLASWVDTNNSGTVPEFYTSNLTYKDNATYVPLTSLDIGKTNLVSLTVNSRTGQFVNPLDGYGNTFILSHIFCPSNTTLYQNTQTTLRQNFLNDRAIQIAGAASVNGEFYGTNYAVFSNVVITYVSANVCTVTFNVSYSAAAQAILKANLFNYALLVTVE